MVPGDDAGCTRAWWNSADTDTSAGWGNRVGDYVPEPAPPADNPNPYGNPPGTRTKQVSPRWKRKAKARRRTALAKHHRKVMKMAKAGKPVSYPKRPAP